MTRSGFLKGVVFLLLFAGLSAAAWSQVTISGGLALSVVNGEESYNGGSTYKVDGKMGIGGNVYVDYLLPIGIPLSLGFEIGIDGAALDGPEAGYDSGDIKITAIPLLLRAAYHFDLHPQLDLYVVGKIGYALGSGEIGNEKEDGFNGLGFGVDLGAAFYFMPRFGLFAEGGIDVYNLSKDFSGSYDDGHSTTSYNVTTKLPFYRFLTIGLSTKF